MRSSTPRLPAPSVCLIAFALAAATVSASASDIASSAGSSASSAGSASSGSVADSLRSSSGSSGRERTAAGRYRITDVAALTERPGWWRVQLAAETGAADPVVLWLPERVVQREALAAGQPLTLSEREYGYALTRADAAAPFYLLLHDDALRELPARAV